MQNELANEMQTLLNDERDVLLSGKLEGMSDIAERKQTLANRLIDIDADPIERDRLSMLIREAKDNQALFAASMFGLRSAQARIREVRDASRQLDTYTNGGEKRNLLEGTRRFERRA